MSEQAPEPNPQAHEQPKFSWDNIDSYLDTPLSEMDLETQRRLLGAEAPDATSAQLLRGNERSIPEPDMPEYFNFSHTRERVHPQDALLDFVKEKSGLNEDQAWKLLDEWLPTWRDKVKWMKVGDPESLAIPSALIRKHQQIAIENPPASNGRGNGPAGIRTPRRQNYQAQGDTGAQTDTTSQPRARVGTPSPNKRDIGQQPPKPAGERTDLDVKYPYYLKEERLVALDSTIAAAIRDEAHRRKDSRGVSSLPKPEFTELTKEVRDRILDDYFDTGEDIPNVVKAEVVARLRKMHSPSTRAPRAAATGRTAVASSYEDLLKLFPNA